MNNDAEILYALYAAALDAMRTTGPTAMPVRIRFEAELRGASHLAAPAVLVTHLQQAPIGDRILKRLRLALAAWDADALAGWSDGTKPRTQARRDRIYDLLALDATTTRAITAAMPVAMDEAVVVSRVFEPWYQRVMSGREAFYWTHYADYLAAKNWDENAIAALDLNSTRVIERLADPERVEAYRAKGLVVGYVQSGKTANFTAVVAKAIDAGYRLIIVLTGQTDLLRNQTQRRLDKELVGVENLMRGIDESDEESLLTVDYIDDPDWPDFVRHGDLPARIGLSDIYRLTTHRGDYRSLQTGISSLDFDKIDPGSPLNAVVNLHHVPARLAIVKKNKTVLTKFVRDLRRITARLAEIPALIIDDESDQASINTSNPDKWEEGHTERTAINGLISQLLELLPRGQYVGYTATPFASVFVDPSDAVDIFPRDFILSLDRPPGYMGAREFHDLDGLPEDEPVTPATSNERAYVRPIYDEDDDEARAQALDAFVLSGAIKLFREEAGNEPGRFRHHTMLVHESVKQAEHRELADRIRETWRSAGYYGTAGMARLAVLFNEDMLPVMQARAGTELVPGSFDEIRTHIGEVVTRIEGSDNDPVLIINGDAEVAAHDLDFEKRDVWKILIGGAKLSRGFTVEGLTVSFYRRRTQQADTLMQMGRWFGFRAGFQDLVRLYIRRGERTGSKPTLDLYVAFEAVCRSEEDFRSELERYGRLDDGVPVITPAEVPPLVAQHLGWLQPAASNKMYNAQLVERRSPGRPLEPTGYPKKPADIEHNLDVLLPLIDRASSDGQLAYKSEAKKTRTYPVKYGLVDHPELAAMLRRLRWLPHDHFQADLTWLEGLTPERLTDWAVILPQHVGGPRATIKGRGPLSIYRRQRRRDPQFGAISDPKHRVALNCIAGLQTDVDGGLASELRRERRGALMLYPVLEALDGAAVPSTIAASRAVIALLLLAPVTAGSPDGALARFVVRDPSRADEPIVDA